MKEIQSLSQATAITGEPSLQNSLELAVKSLKNLPSHASREILVIMGSLTTCDPGDITETIQVQFRRILFLKEYQKNWDFRFFLTKKIKNYRKGIQQKLQENLNFQYEKSKRIKIWNSKTWSYANCNLKSGRTALKFKFRIFFKK